MVPCPTRMCGAAVVPARTAMGLETESSYRDVLSGARVFRYCVTSCRQQRLPTCRSKRLLAWCYLGGWHAFGKGVWTVASEIFCPPLRLDTGAPTHVVRVYAAPAPVMEYARGGVHRASASRNCGTCIRGPVHHDRACLVIRGGSSYRVRGASARGGVRPWWST